MRLHEGVVDGEIHLGLSYIVTSTVARVDTANVSSSGPSLTTKPGGNAGSMATVLATLTKEKPPSKSKHIVILLRGPTGKHAANLGMRVDEPDI